LWDTTENVFLHCGIQGKRFFSVVDKTEKNLRMANKFFSVVFYNARVFLPLYPTPQQNLMRCTVSHNTTQKNCGIQHRKFFHIVSHNATGFLPLYPTMEDIFPHCGIQRKRFFSVAGYNRRGFPPLRDTTEEVFSVVGYNGRGFFLLWEQWRK
jgi:hypothetical protein